MQKNNMQKTDVQKNTTTSNDKLLQVLSLLMHPDGITIQELADKVETSERTIYRIKEIIMRTYPNIEKFKRNNKVYFRIQGLENMSPLPNLQKHEIDILDTMIQQTDNVDHKRILKKLQIFILSLGQLEEQPNLIK